MIRGKKLQEENLDLRTEIEFLRRANEKYKSELLRQSKTLEVSPRNAPTIRPLVKSNYRSKYSPRSAGSTGSIRVLNRPGASPYNVSIYITFLT